MTPNPLIGIALILLSGFLLASHDALSKQLALLYSVFLIVWARNLTQLLVMTIGFAPRMGLDLLRTRRPLLQLTRALSQVGISVFLLVGLRYIPLGEATAVMFLSPLFVTLLSVLLLKERVSLGQWVSVLLGFAGVLVIVRPGGELFTPAILWPLAASLCLSVYMLLTRRLNGTDHPVTTNYLSGLIATLLFSLAVPFVWEVPEGKHLLMMVGMGVLGMSGHLLLTRAYAYGSAATLAPFTYGQIFFATLLGAVLFEHMPDALGLLGMAVLIASGGLSVVLQRLAARP